MITTSNIPNHVQGVFPIRKVNAQTGEVEKEYDFFSGVMLNPDVVSLGGLDPAVVSQHWMLIRKLACVENSPFSVLQQNGSLAELESQILHLRRELNPAVPVPTFSTGYRDHSWELSEYLGQLGIDSEIILPAVHLNLWLNEEEYRSAYREFRTSLLMQIPFLRTRAIAIEDPDLLLRRQWEGLEFSQWSSEYYQKIGMMMGRIGLGDDQILSSLAEFGGTDVAGWKEHIQPISEEIPATKKLLDFILRHEREHEPEIRKYSYDQIDGLLYVHGKMTREELDELLGFYNDNKVRNAIRRLYHQSQIGKKVYRHVYRLHSGPAIVKTGLRGTQFYERPIYLEK